MICPRCSNQNVDYFYWINSQAYCRKCISFGRVFINDTRTLKQESYVCNAQYHLTYSLTKEQLEISKELVNSYQHHQDSNVKAVCGAGKTEIVYEVIKTALNKGHRVCFTTPRVALTKELYLRMQAQFTGVTMSLVCGGHSQETTGQFIVCTTHQLHRFYQAFDLLILDELDAFPYRNNEILQALVFQSIRGSHIFMSATMQDSHESILTLSKRYHGQPLPVPKCIIGASWIAFFILIVKILAYRKRRLPVLVYVPTIAMTTKMVKMLRIFTITSKAVHSKVTNSDEVMELLTTGKIDVIVCTTILERGITIDNVQVLVFEGQHRIYDRDTLIQIAGRVGRKITHPTGNVTIFSQYKTKDIKECIKSIQQDNA